LFFIFYIVGFLRNRKKKKPKQIGVKYKLIGSQVIFILYWCL